MDGTGTFVASYIFNYMSNSIVAYHGSNVKISKFDLSKLKTGQGSNDWGVGVYFTDNAGLANKHGNFIHTVTINQANTLKQWEEVASKELLVYTLQRLMKGNHIDDETAKGFLNAIKEGEEINYLGIMNYVEELVGIKETVKLFREFGINGLIIPSEGSSYGTIYSILNPDIINIDKVAPSQKQELTNRLREALRIVLSGTDV